MIQHKLRPRAHLCLALPFGHGWSLPSSFGQLWKARHRRRRQHTQPVSKLLSASFTWWWFGLAGTPRAHGDPLLLGVTPVGAA